MIVSRALIVGFIQHLAKQDLNPMTRRITLLNLRTFHQTVIQEEWLDWPVKPIIFGRDLPNGVTISPKYIDKDVMQNQADRLSAKDKQLDILTKQNRLLRQQVDEIKMQLEVVYADLYKKGD